jgi:TldD protein
VWFGENWSADDEEHLGLGVRALINGYWGFAATPYWTPEEAVRVAHAAVALCAVSAHGIAPRSVELGHNSAVTGSWTTPIKIDPFRVPVEEKLDCLRSSLVTFQRTLPERSRFGGPNRMGLLGIELDMSFYRQEHALATTEGSYVTQTIYRTAGSTELETFYPPPGGRAVIAAYTTAMPRGLNPAGVGWEMFPEARLVDQLPALLAEAESKQHPPVKPVEVGRYTVVCDAATMANLLDATLGRATQLDRALGYEANETGTSYLGPNPLAMLGTTVASNAVTVTADRSMPTGLATVKWDSEGVEPQPFQIVRGGTLVDYQTTREQAAWLAPWYQRTGAPVQSHGCAALTDATFPSILMTPNLTLEPASGGTDFEEMISQVADGIAVEAGEVETDFQCRNGMIRAIAGRIFRVKGGKRIAGWANACVPFDAPQLWRSVAALGGPASAVNLPGSEVKGKPIEYMPGRNRPIAPQHTLRTVPAIFTNMTVADVTKKA